VFDLAYVQLILSLKPFLICVPLKPLYMQTYAFSEDVASG